MEYKKSEKLSNELAEILNEKLLEFRNRGEDLIDVIPALSAFANIVFGKVCTSFEKDMREAYLKNFLECHEKIMKEVDDHQRSGGNEN